MLDSADRERGLRQQAWDVYLHGKKIDTVFYDPGCEKWEVHDGLVNHDGYDPRIVLRKERSE